ncbi:MAG: VWA domain-containing protein, partial [Myxococcota bacterium]
MMDGKIVDFTALLRTNGLRVSMAEHLDAFHAVAQLGLVDREAFKAALRATMVKRAIDVATYDELFDLYFSGLGEAIRDTASGLMQAMQIDPQQLQSLMDQLAQILKDMDVDLSELAQALLQNDTGRLERLLREAAEQANAQGIERSYQEGRYSHSTAQSLGLGGLSEELDRLKQQLGNAALPPDLNEALQQFIEQRLRDLREMIRRTVRIELEKRDQSQREKNRLQSLAEKSFYYLSEDELRRMREAVTKLAQRLKNVVSIRRKRGKRGKFDLADTMRKNLQYGSVPFRIQFDRKIRDKPQVLVLCDVSDSVRNVSRFMLQFVYSLQDLYSRVRSFI